ncbi:MAG TPA: protein kinase [Pyrinomonadaceae bacterium]|nr:protein kinase [Pyrinomonadaceae bacterium]
MKNCPTCGRQYADTNTLCPADGTVLKKDADDDRLIGQVLAGKYRIEEKIDEGGMGCVYRATHVLMEKTVAVKVLHPALAADDKIVARFTREAKAASRISHPHAISVTDFGESENGIVYLVMEYLRGRTLKDISRGEGPLPLARVVEIVRQVSGALEAAHAEGVVHRDLKSDNIMLEETPGGDWAKVLDFGIAKIQQTAQSVHETDPGLTSPNLIIGTPQYMSPEQCSQASNIDTRSDVYSFGVILYEMLAGHVPFAGDSPTAIMMKHLQEPPPSILEERKDLPAGVGRVIARALAKRPEDRYQKAGELYEELNAAAGETPSLSTSNVSPAVPTARVVVPTGQNEPARATLGERDDEATVVSADHARPRTDELPPPVAPVHEHSTFSPWRIAVPALAALAIIFAVVYAMQSRTGPVSSQDPTPPLQTDPNGQPVQSITPPTGQAERNLAPASGTPTPGAPGEVIGGALPATPSGNANPAPSATPARGNANQNPQEDENSNDDDDPEPEATPTPRPKNTPEPNVKPTPVPPPERQAKPAVTPDKDDKPPQLEDGTPPSP